MSDKLLTLLKDSQHIKCWYPCSGDDFEVTKIWTKDHKNSNIPDLFILTDINMFEIFQEADNFETRLKNEGYTLIDEFIINTNLSLVKEIHWAYNNISNEEVYGKKYREILNNDYFFDHLYPTRDNETQIMSKEDLLELDNMMQIGINISSFENLPSNQKLNLINIIQDTPTDKNIRIYHNRDIKIVLMNCKNNEFYDFCIENEIGIESLILKGGHNDNYLISELHNICKSLNINTILASLYEFNEAHKEFLMQYQIGLPINYSSYLIAQNNRPPLQLSLHSKI